MDSEPWSLRVAIRVGMSAYVFWRLRAFDNPLQGLLLIRVSPYALLEACLDIVICWHIVGTFLLVIFSFCQ